MFAGSTWAQLRASTSPPRSQGLVEFKRGFATDDAAGLPLRQRSSTAQRYARAGRASRYARRTSRRYRADELRRLRRGRDNAYRDSAAVYDALCAHKDYAARFGSRSSSLSGASTRMPARCSTSGAEPAVIWSIFGESFDVEGLDRSPQMLDLARRTVPRGRVPRRRPGRFRPRPGRSTWSAASSARSASPAPPDGLERAVAAIGRRHVTPGGARGRRALADA